LEGRCPRVSMAWGVEWQGGDCGWREVGGPVVVGRGCRTVVDVFGVASSGDVGEWAGAVVARRGAEIGEVGPGSVCVSD